MQSLLLNKARKLNTMLMATLGLALAAAMLPPAALAQNVYLGVGAGQSSTDIECDLDTTCSTDEEDTAFKIFGGYQFNPNFAIEAGYVDLGEGSISGTDSFLGVTSATLEVSGFTLAAVGTIPLNERFNLFGKAGLFLWDMDVSIRSSVFGSGTLTEDGTDLMLGVGASFELARNIALRAEWERFLDVGDADTTGESDIDLISASIVFRF